MLNSVTYVATTPYDFFGLFNEREWFLLKMLEQSMDELRHVEQHENLGKVSSLFSTLAAIRGSTTQIRKVGTPAMIGYVLDAISFICLLDKGSRLFRRPLCQNSSNSLDVFKPYG